MKKILVLFALTAIAMVSVNAQDNLKWGVMAGMNVSKYTFTGFDNRVGFHAGVKAELGVICRKQVGHTWILLRY